MMNRFRRLRPRDGGFTLVELLVVIVIVALISAVALPVVLPALDERRVSEAARELQGALAGARDAAIRANAPRGIRLLPDPILAPAPFGTIALGSTLTGILTSNRYVPIEPGPDYSEGLVYASNFPTAYTGTIPNPSPNYFLQVSQSTQTQVGFNVPAVYIPNEPTGWFFNIRQGDKIRFNDSGAYYTIAGPLAIGPSAVDNQGNLLTNIQQNTERFINAGLSFVQGLNNPEYLYLVNGVDDDGDGWVDEGFDGIDNDGDGIIDPGFNGIDDNQNGSIDESAELFIGNEWENEQFVGDPPTANNVAGSAYTILRRPVVSPGTREVTLPDGIVVDLTTWNSPAATKITAATQGVSNITVQLPERSRLPVDPYNYSVDILVSPSGQVVQAGAGAAGIEQNNSSPTSNLPFYHFWLTERKGVVAPIWDTPASRAKVPYVPAVNASYPNVLPMPQGTANYTPAATQNTQYLLGERRLVTMFTRSGQVVTNSIEADYDTTNNVISGFNGLDISQPYYDAQAGLKDPK